MKNEKTTTEAIYNIVSQVEHKDTGNYFCSVSVTLTVTGKVIGHVVSEDKMVQVRGKD